MPDLRDLKGSLTKGGPLIGYAASTVSSGACTVIVAGIETTVRAASGLTIAVGDTLLIQRVGSAYFATTVLSAAPAVPPPPPPPPDAAPPDTGDAAPTPKPTITTGTLVCTPVATSTYRGTSWRSDGDPVNSFDTYQGRYAGSSFGRRSRHRTASAL